MANIPSHRMSTLGELTKSQQDRLAHIDFRLYFFGELRRADVVERFGIGPAGATRDIALYKEVAPGNLSLDNTDKVYRPTSSFNPVFEHSPRRVLSALCEGFGDGMGDERKDLLRCETPIALSLPSVAVLAPITRAIHRRNALRIKYTSVDSGRTQRDIVPFALVDTGPRWHVRAYDRRREQFRDFVLTRIEEPSVLEDDIVRPEENAEADAQWNRVIELELVVHPAHPRPEVVRLDYALPRDGALRVKVRAANVGYMLRQASVDCSVDHRLSGPEYALWLRDPLTLYGASNAVLAPGYEDPKSSRQVKAF